MLGEGILTSCGGVSLKDEVLPLIVNGSIGGEALGSTAASGLIEEDGAIGPRGVGLESTVVGARCGRMDPEGAGIAEGGIELPEAHRHGVVGKLNGWFSLGLNG